MTTDKSVFLLLGPETGEKETFIRDLISRVEKEKKTEVYKFFAHETPFLEIISLLKNRLLFSDHKAVIVFGLENMKKSETGLLEDYLRSPAPYSTLFLCSDEIKISPPGLADIVPAENKKIFWELLEHQKRGWVNNFFLKRSIRIEEEALDFIIEMVENNTRDLASICERLAIYFGKNSIIRFDDIENFIYHSKEENVFTLFAGIVKRDFALSLEILEKILLAHETDATRILSGILWQVHNLAQFFVFLDQGLSSEKAFLKLGVRTKRQQKLYNEARANFTLPELLHIVSTVAIYDTWFRVHNQNVHRILLEKFLYSITKETRRLKVSLS